MKSEAGGRGDLTGAAGSSCELLGWGRCVKSLQATSWQERPMAAASLSTSPPLGSGEGPRSPSPLERSPGSEPPSPGPATSPVSPDLDPEAVRGALRDFLQELRSTQRERVRPVRVAGWGIGWPRVWRGAAVCQSRGLPFPPPRDCRMSFGPRQVPWVASWLTWRPRGTVLPPGQGSCRRLWPRVRKVSPHPIPGSLPCSWQRRWDALSGSCFPALGTVT